METRSLTFSDSKRCDNRQTYQVDKTFLINEGSEFQGRLVLDTVMLGVMSVVLRTFGYVGLLKKSRG